VPALLGKSSVWIEQWRLDEAQSRELLIALANVVKVSGWEDAAAGSMTGAQGGRVEILNVLVRQHGHAT
jgi:hypothetical protein